MKLNPDFAMQDVGDQTVLVPTGLAAESFHGIVRLNESAAFLAKLLQEETTPDALVDALEKEYDGTQEQFRHSVETTIVRLREAGAILE